METRSVIKNWLYSLIYLNKLIFIKLKGVQYLRGCIHATSDEAVPLFHQYMSE
jgi:hypothetical protein